MSRDNPQHRRRTNRTQSTPRDHLWFYGVHPVMAALSNRHRPCYDLMVARSGRLSQQFHTLLQRHKPSCRFRLASAQEIDKILGHGTIAHQNVALQVGPLPSLGLETLQPNPKNIVVALDQINDPHNVGAIIRSAAAYGARAVILTKNHAPPLASALAKAASGGLDMVPIISVTNLARSLKTLNKHGWTTIGLAEEAATPLAKVLVDHHQPTVIVVGHEGQGLRRLTRECCQYITGLAMASNLKSSYTINLNVSNAAAVALSQIFAHHQTRALSQAPSRGSLFTQK